ncbi:MAG: hypothetical protein AVDCRST_MAG14-1187, partial [uncultured Rubrobacteraceae bacterium]
ATRTPLPRVRYPLAHSMGGVAKQRRGGRDPRHREARRDRGRGPRAPGPHKDRAGLPPARLLHPVPLGGERRGYRADPLRCLRAEV